MADIKFQYNKTELQNIRKQLSIRINALPTLKNKESALRIEVIKLKVGIKSLINEFELKNKELEKFKSLYTEFPDIFSLKSLNVRKKKIAGVNIPLIENINFKVDEFSLFNTPFWVLEGVEILKSISDLMIKIIIEEKKIKILDYARKKTTQKVNLYEKVQIPSFENAILKIKRYLEDVDNLDKSSQKIVKRRLAEADGLS